MASPKLVLVAGVLLIGQLASAQAPFSITRDSWNPTTDPAVQKQRDVNFMCATLFPNPEAVDKLLKLAKDKKVQASILDSKQRTKVLARIFVAMAYGGLNYCLGPNDVEHLQPWDKQLATALSHGQRVVFQVTGVDAKDIYNLFVNGYLKADFEDPYGRTAASHGFEWNKRRQRLEEVKYKKWGLFYAVTDGLRGKHHGINLPFGGLGNPRMDGNLIGPQGYAMLPTGKLEEKLQQGHLFLHDGTRVEKGRVVEGCLMVGLEGSAPGTRNMYGSTHDASSASKDSTKETGVNGGQKMQVLYGAAAPAQVGGMWVMLNPNQFEELQGLIRDVDNSMSGKDAPEFFRRLLSDDAAEARALLEQAYPRRDRPVPRRK